MACLKKGCTWEHVAPGDTFMETLPVGSANVAIMIYEGRGKATDVRLTFCPECIKGILEAFVVEPRAKKENNDAAR